MLVNKNYCFLCGCGLDTGIFEGDRYFDVYVEYAKQYYYYSVEQWLKGDPNNPSPPEARKKGRNHQWKHLDNAEIISMPDKWEYPWYAAWDLAFHALPLAMLDAEFAQEMGVSLFDEQITLKFHSFNRQR